MRRVLIVDDNAALADAIPHLLGPGFQTFRATNGEEACARIVADQAFDVVLCDILMPRLDGLGLLEWVRGCHPQLEARFVFMTVAPELPAAVEIARTHRVLRKPFGRAELLAAMSSSSFGGSEEGA
jgi:CheY-like chemotaxis protein